MAVTVQRIGSKCIIKLMDVDPDSNSAALAAPDGVTTPWYFDLQLAGLLLVGYRPTVGNGITLMRLFASVDIAGATSATLIATSGAVVADALADQVFLEITAEQVAQIADAAGLPTLRYITVELTHATNTNEGCLLFVGCEARYPRDALTTTVIT